MRAPSSRSERSRSTSRARWCSACCTALGATGDTILLLGTALLGSFTTFSTWMLETEGLREGREGGMAAANVAISLALGLAAVALGWAVGAAI